MRTLFAILTALVLGACTVGPAPEPGPAPQSGAVQTVVVTQAEFDTAVRNFLRVIETVEPVAERECRARTQGVKCDFLIVVDDRTTSPPNAFQTLDPSGRPVVGFTVALIAQARNQDELAFILGHEAAHHIEGHIGKARRSAVSGAVAAGILATLGGADPDGVREAQSFGASLGARRFSKSFELEADALGTLIAARAGFDPVRGAEYFNRVPDPGNQFLGTHPPNADRIATVRRVAARL